MPYRRLTLWVMFLFSIVAFAVIRKRNLASSNYVLPTCLEFLYIVIMLDLKPWPNNLSVVVQNIHLSDNFNGLRQ